MRERLAKQGSSKYSVAFCGDFFQLSSRNGVRLTRFVAEGSYGLDNPLTLCLFLVQVTSTLALKAGKSKMTCAS